MDNFLSKLSSNRKSTVLEPREIFMSTVGEGSRYSYPRDIQSQVWENWFENRTKKNTIIKMNTGAGKTVTGLMMLQSCLNEGLETAIYVVPDNFLVEQVLNEASELGIQATQNKDDYNYLRGKAILVIPIQTLVNGKSVFGMRGENNYPIDSLLIDDIHACMDTISTQFSMSFDYNNGIYKECLNCLAFDCKAYNKGAYSDVFERKTHFKDFVVPFWIWEQNLEKIIQILTNPQYQDDSMVKFQLPLIQDSLKLCSCIITSSKIEITPKSIDISKIQSFTKAKRRIFMSATLKDDSSLISTLGLNESEIDSVITPKKANDVGERLFLFPQFQNNQLSDIDVRDNIIVFSKQYNVTVIVPSRSRAKFWTEVDGLLIDKNNIQKTVERMKSGHVGLTILVNRYDGIDLPNDACRMLVIDGVPLNGNLYHRYIQGINPMNKTLLTSQMQKIEQGTGRGIRSHSDSCCVVFLGKGLTDVLIRSKGKNFFSEAMLTQFNLSQELWDALNEDESFPKIEKIFKLADYSLKRDKGWIQECKQRLVALPYNTNVYIQKTVVHLQSAFKYGLVEHWDKAIGEIDKAIEIVDNDNDKAFLMQEKADYINHLDPAKAQEILLSATKFSRTTLKPIEGIVYQKKQSSNSQAKGLYDTIENTFKNPNEYRIYIEKLLSQLTFKSKYSDFEQAIQELGVMIGFSSDMPDRETNGAGPDNLWLHENKTAMVLECKNEAQNDEISKDYCNQLGGSQRWFNEQYGQNYNVTPVLIHRSTKISEQATPPLNMRIITEEKLEFLTTALEKFSIAIAQSSNWMDKSKIDQQLKMHKLQVTDIVNNYTVPPSR